MTGSVKGVIFEAGYGIEGQATTDRAKGVAAMRSGTISILFFTASLFIAVPTFGQYRTPGTGETYSLEELVPLAAGILVDTGSGLVLNDHLIISPSDTLQISGGELLLATREMKERSGQYGTYLAEVIPALIIEGSLDAEGWTLGSVPGTESNTSGCGLLVSGVGTPEPASAGIRNCTIDRVSMGLTVRGETTVTVEDSTFTGCFNSGVITYMGASLTVIGSNFFDCGLASTGTANLDLQNLHIERDGLLLRGTSETSTIAGCTIVGPGLTGVYAGGESRGRVAGNRIGGFDFGVFCSNTSGVVLEDNAIWGNSESGIVADGTSTPMLRGNRISYNSLPISSPEGEDARPCILILDDAQPDLGTDADPGLNVIHDNGGVSLYNASTGTVSARGNDWGSPSEAAVEDMVYHQPDDGEDADGSGFLSGPVLLSPVRTLEGGFPSPDLDEDGEVEPDDLLLFQREWHKGR